MQTARNAKVVYKTTYKPKGSVMVGTKKKSTTTTSASTPRTINSRFGEVTVDIEKKINFPFGIVGLPQSLNFIITDMPQKAESRFKLLQSLEDESFSFVVLPVDIQNTFIAREDTLEMCAALNISEENLLLLLIASVRKNLDGTSTVSVNARAPIAIDTADKAGIQYVFPHNKYEICTPLTVAKKIVTLPLKHYAYVEAFRCLGGDCADTCCKGWGMQLDAPHQQLYAKEAPELLSAVDSGEAEFIMKRDPTTDYCVKFDNGWCGIHKEYGEKFLGDACHFYPRITRQVSDTQVMSAALSCPEIVRLVLHMEQPFALKDTTLERLPYQIKNAAPADLTAEQTMAVIQGFMALTDDPTISAEHAMTRIITVALGMANVPVTLWPTGVEVGLLTADSRMLAAEPNPMDVYTLVQTLCGLMYASKKTARPRLQATLTTWQNALGMRLDLETYDVIIDKDKTYAPLHLTERWKYGAQQALAPVLKCWIQAQISMALFPFAGFGADITERVITLSVRFATLRWALMAHMASDGTPPDSATIERVIQSLARFMDHLADPTLSMNYYTQAGWNREPRLRALVGHV